MEAREATAVEAPPEPLVRRRIERVIADGERTQAQLAKEAGISGSALSAWMRESYAGNNEAVEEALSRWLSARDARQAFSGALPAAPGWIETATAKRIMEVCSYAQLFHDFCLVVGLPGVGKTFAIDRYAQSHPNVWHVVIRPSIESVAGVIEEIARVALVRGVKSKCRHASAAIVARLSGANALLVIDEAQHLGDKALEEIRFLHDASGCGLVLAGNEHVYARVAGNHRDATFAQLFSRVGKRLRLTRPGKADMEPFLDGLGVPDKDCRDFLKRLSGEPGALRGVEKCFRLAAFLAAGAGAPLSTRHLSAAWKDLGGEARP